ncbi:MAG: GTP 3',8-cyclase MoaA [Clostridia bacterium]|nr:GTP 3',8-cyclase MoaA [Clostridia bacterium]
MKDGFGREITYLRMSVTELCNLRCRYCMPAEGVRKRRHGEMLTQEDMLRAVGVAAELGIRKLRVTGGEPLVKRNIVAICEGAAQTPGIEEIGLTTNGTLLPALAKPLKAAGISRLNISIDTLDEKKYAWMTRLGSLDQAIRGIEAALEAGFARVKLNAVLIGGFNDDEIRPLAQLSARWPVDVRFIELMPMPGGMDFGPQAYIPCDRVIEALPELEPVPGGDGVARLYRLPNARGRVGLISPLSDNFCGWCNRLRLTADGRVKPCLHSPAEFSIVGLDREGMRRQFLAACAAKPEQHPLLSCAHRSAANRSMNRIGG